MANALWMGAGVREGKGGPTGAVYREALQREVINDGLKVESGCLNREVDAIALR
jgi:hypothetical protein